MNVISSSIIGPYIIIMCYVVIKGSSLWRFCVDGFDCGGVALRPPVVSCYIKNYREQGIAYTLWYKRLSYDIRCTIAANISLQSVQPVSQSVIS
jgi:hypothetical protein